VSRNHWISVGGLENRRMEQVSEMVELGFTITELFPCITAAAAGAERRVEELFREIRPPFSVGANYRPDRSGKSFKYVHI
jgi:hypothetical protein